MKIGQETSDRFLPSESRSNRHTKYCLLIFSLALSISILFALYTNHAWEDYFITFRASKNLASGQGLVYTEGERLHTYTSPLGVLIPAMLSQATGNERDELVLWLFRIISASAFALSVVLLYRIARSCSLGSAATIFLVGMIAFDAKCIDFSINGMETGLMILFLSLTLHTMMVPVRFQSMKLGIAWAGLMWVRPDSIIYIGGLALAFLLFNPGSPLPSSRLATLRVFCISGLFAAILYIPWLGWTWHYYGSSIPNTAVAKGFNNYHDIADLLLAFSAYPFVSLFLSKCFSATFLPSYASQAGWPDLLFLWSKGLAYLGTTIWILPGLDRKFRAVSLAAMIAGFYIDAIGPYPFPWYIPPFAILSIAALSGLVQKISQWIGRKRQTLDCLSGVCRDFAVRFSVLAILIPLVLSILTAYQIRIQQHLIEEGNRREIGLWLSRNSSSKFETVFLEPLGYIGYYSQLKMMDFPGLASREVVEARKKLGSDNANELIRELKPDWLVLRSAEVQRIKTADQDLFVLLYCPVKTFDVSKRVGAYSWLPGRDYLVKDQAYIIFKRRI